MIKLVVFVPVDAADTIRKVLGEAGAGALGDYRNCSFSFIGKGRFTPEEGSNPTIGKVGQQEVVTEERIEVIVKRSKAKSVIAAMKSAHPYEHPAYDIIELLDEDEL